MRKIYISVVSHGHGNLINEIDCLSFLNEVATVVVKNNIEDNSLTNYCRVNGIDLIDHEYNLGFGENNNVNYLYCRSIGMSDNDLFLVLNPDVKIDIEELLNFLNIVASEKFYLSTINLFLDDKSKEFDQSIRKFPSLINFVSSFLGFGNASVIDKSNLNKITTVDWAAGSFLCFRAGWYHILRGFDEGYFMYCEDIDICYRSSTLGVALNYIPSVTAVHLARHSNRRIFSKHFYWHLKSALRFLKVKYISKGINVKSRI
ncbi:glycosyltransferase family 2 protein [Vibrio cyclitrophicus]